MHTSSRDTGSVAAAVAPAGAARREPSASRFQCSLCGEAVAPDHWVEHQDLENFVLVEIRRLNPQWIEKDGGCRRCIRAYRLLGRARSAATRLWRSAARPFAA